MNKENSEEKEQESESDELVIEEKEEAQPEKVETSEGKKPSSKSKAKTIFLYLLLATLVAAFAGGGVYLWRKQKIKNAAVEEETKTDEKAEEESTEKKETKVTTDENSVYTTALPGLNLRETASLTGKIIKELPYKSKMKIEKEEGDWYYGTDEKGDKGYFAKTFTSKTDPVSVWLTYNGGNYTTKYPDEWLKKVCDDSGYAGFGPNNESLQVCNSEGSALVSVNKISQSSKNYITDIKTTLDDFTESSIKVSGADVTRVSGTTKAAEMGPAENSRMVSVVISIGEESLLIGYLQQPGGVNYEGVFDIMVENFSLAE